MSRDGITGGKTLNDTVLVVGQIARDLIVSVDEIPEANRSTDIHRRLEQLGGKGGNQAVGLAQLGARPALLGVAGDDDQGENVLATAQKDGIDVGAVVRRGITALMIDIVDGDQERRLFEHTPEGGRLTVADVEAHRDAVLSAGVVSLQLQEPGEVLVAVAELAASVGALVVLDGVADEHVMDELLPHASALRADAHEGQLLTGVELTDADAAVQAAEPLLKRGLQVVAFTLTSHDNIVIWRGGHCVHPFTVTDVVDRTGNGDSYVAGLITGLLATGSAEKAGELAAATSQATVQVLGGRPDLTGLRP